MKKYFNISLTAIMALTFNIYFSGCVKEVPCHKTYTYSYYNPVYKTTAEVRANIKSNPSRDVQNPGKLYILGKYIFLNEIDKGIHIIDNSNPSSPKNVAFIDVPGNVDMAVKGNTLYADLYSDLVTIDITNPLNIVVKKYNEGVFPYRAYGNGFYNDTNKIIVDWIKRDTMVTQDCMSSYGMLEDRSVFFLAASNSSGDGSSKASVSPIGQGGSMARFAIVNNRMYAVSNSDLNVFNISSPNDPAFSNTVNLNNWAIETIFPFKNKLFIGSQNGMFIYDISNPDNPAPAGQFAHVRSCDPVIADDSFAYVTLRSGTACQGFTNQLDVLQLNNLTDPQLLKSYDFTNPHGLSKDGNILFVCDGSAGLKVYDASDVKNLKLIKQISLETYDVIAYNNIALVVAKDGLYQYDYSKVNEIKLLSKIGILR
ncbi:MAG: hypothetical protein ABIN97_19825 [Ginsengibacter sp.]